jgi:hypothetical protein
MSNSNEVSWEEDIWKKINDAVVMEAHSHTCFVLLRSSC